MRRHRGGALHAVHLLFILVAQVAGAKLDLDIERFIRRVSRRHRSLDAAFAAAYWFGGLGAE